MSVVINDFEVIAEPEQPTVSRAPEDRSAAPRAAGVRPLDLRDALAHQARRAERLRAH